MLLPYQSLLVCYFPNLILPWHLHFQVSNITLLVSFHMIARKMWLFIFFLCFPWYIFVPLPFRTLKCAFMSSKGWFCLSPLHLILQEDWWQWALSSWSAIHCFYSFMSLRQPTEASSNYVMNISFILTLVWVGRFIR